MAPLGSKECLTINSYTEEIVVGQESKSGSEYCLWYSEGRMSDSLIENQVLHRGGIADDRLTWEQWTSDLMGKIDHGVAERRKQWLIRAAESQNSELVEGAELLARQLLAEASYEYVSPVLVAGLMTGEIVFESDGSLVLSNGGRERFRERVVRAVGDGYFGVAGVSDHQVLIGESVELARYDYGRKATAGLVEAGVSLRDLGVAVRAGLGAVFERIREVDQKIWSRKQETGL